MSSILGALGGSALGGGTIGKAIVQLDLKADGYSKGLKDAEGNVKKSTSGIGGSLDKLKGLAVAGAAVAGAALVKFGVDSVQAAVEAAASQAKLANSIANSTAVSFDAIPALQQQAGALRDLTGVDDDAINAGESLLVNMGLTADQIQELAPLVVDLSAKTGIGLESAFKATGKAASGSTGALARYLGPIAAGSTKAETYANVLQALGKNAGFAGDRAKAEPWRLLSAAFGEAQEQVGKKLLPAIQAITPALIPLANFIGDVVSPVVENLAQDAQVLGEAVKFVTDQLPSSDSAIASNSGEMTGWQKATGIATASLATWVKSIAHGRDQLGFLERHGKSAQEQTDALTKSTSAEAAAQSKAAEQVAKHAQALRDQRKAMRELADPMLALIGDLQQLHDDQAAVNQLQAQGKTHTREYRDAMLQLLGDQNNVNGSIRDLAKQMRDANATTKDAKQRLYDLGRQAGLSKTQVDNITDSVKGFNDALDRTSRRGPIHIPLVVDIRTGDVPSGVLGAAVRQQLINDARSNGGKTGL